MTEAAVQTNDHDDSVMVCLRPSLRTRTAYASLSVTTESLDELHVTLWYGGNTAELGGEMGQERLYRACYGLAIDPQTPRLTGRANGFGWFLNEDSDVLVSLWDIPYVNEFRQALISQLSDHGVSLRDEDHGFTPHMSLSYQDETDYTIPQIPQDGSRQESFDSLWMVWAGQWNEIPISTSA